MESIGRTPPSRHADPAAAAAGVRGTRPPRPADEAGRLTALRRYAILDTKPERAFDDLALLAARACGVPVAFIAFVDADRQWIKASIGLESQPTDRDRALAAYAILSDEILVVPDAAADARLREHPLVTGPEAIRFCAGAPLRSASGYPVGAVCVMDRVPRTLDRHQLQALRAVAHQVITHLELQQHRQEQAETVRRLERTTSALEHQLRQSQKMEVVGRLTSGITHDLNNMLTAIQAAADLIAHEAVTGTAELRHEAAELRKAVGRGIGMVRKLLTFGRRQPLLLRPVSLMDLTDDLHTTLQRLLPATIEIQVVVEPGLPNVPADPGAVEQILMNLATNARDAMPDGGILRINMSRAWLDDESRRQLGWGRPGAYVAVAVSDTGCGMDAATRDRVFEPFFTTKRADDGTGLGLAMVFGLMKEHAGFVHVYSEPGQGTTIKLYFPITTKAAVATDHPAEVPPAPRGGTETILVVEDEPPIREAARRVLERFGYQVLTAEDGERGLEMLEERGEEIALVLTDLVMPRVGGQALYEQACSRWPHCRFLFSSGYTARDVEASALLAPGRPFLHKPWTMTELLERVRTLLDAEPAPPDGPARLPG